MIIGGKNMDNSEKLKQQDKGVLVLPDGKRQPMGSDTMVFSVALPKKTVEMLKRMSYQNGKTMGHLVNALIWWGYHAWKGDYKPDEKQG
jgi:hypothetical protein